MRSAQPEPPDGDPGRIESVSAFTRRVKELLESGLAPGWVRGEVSNFRRQSSGHCYFSLKDADAQLGCVLFRGDAARQTLALRDGLQVIACGEISVYEARGQYQLIVRVLIEDGVGRLRQEFEQLKNKLAGEGLFAAERKAPLPLMPATLGFITSPTGAAAQDFIKILQRRGWTGRLVVLPAKVQGAGAAAELLAMLEFAQSLERGPDGGPVFPGADDQKGHALPFTLPDHEQQKVKHDPFFDVLVIGRGGGSLEDLWEFNDEALVRAVAACPVPIISAVGHEIDFTLCDFAADARAETPSAAAELISSNFLAGLGRARQAETAMDAVLDHAVAAVRERLDHARSRLRLLSPAAQIEQGHLRLDDLANRLGAALARAAQMRWQRLTETGARLQQASPERRVQLESHRLLALWKRLQSASPGSVLNRGFVIVRDGQGKPVQKKAAVRPGQRLVNQFADGEVRVTAE